MIRHLDSAAQCKLLSGPFAIFIQVVLAGVCVLTLFVKRALERPQRDIVTWLFDFGKQGVGSVVGHFSNIFLSVYVSSTIRNSNECSWYALSYTADSTVGLLLNIGLLWVMEMVMKRLSPNTVTGFYGVPPQLSLFLPQLLAWTAIILTSKTILLFLLTHFASPLDAVLTAAFQGLFRSPEFELLTVMIIVPTIANVVYFWVVDGFIMQRPHPGEYPKYLSLHESLLTVPSAELEKHNERIVTVQSDWLLQRLRPTQNPSSHSGGVELSMISKT